MKYYSEITQHVYDTPQELAKAERTYKERELKLQEEQARKSAERKRRAKEIENAEAELTKANAAARAAKAKRDELLQAFIKDYGSYHYTLTGNDALDRINQQLEEANNLSKMFDDLFRFKV